MEPTTFLLLFCDSSGPPCSEPRSRTRRGKWLRSGCRVAHCSGNRDRLIDVEIVAETGDQYLLKLPFWTAFWLGVSRRQWAKKTEVTFHGSRH